MSIYSCSHVFWVFHLTLVIKRFKLGDERILLSCISCSKGRETRAYIERRNMEDKINYCWITIFNEKVSLLTQLIFYNFVALRSQLFLHYRFYIIVAAELK